MNPPFAGSIRPLLAMSLGMLVLCLASAAGASASPVWGGGGSGWVDPAARSGASRSIADYDSDGTTCSMYANNAGMGSYCSSGPGEHEPLAERFPDLDFENCRYEEPPAGVEPARNPDPDEKRWQLRTCLTGIDWFSYDGGEDRRFTMELVLVDDDRDTTYHGTALSEVLWSGARSTYPIPMLRVMPRDIPVVGQPAFFAFDWLDAQTRELVSGGPRVEQANRGLVMRARAGAVTIDPQIEGEEAFTCRVSEFAYDEDAGPLTKDQRSDCHYVFARSSAAADDLSTADYGAPDAYQLKVDVRWDVEYGSPARGFRPFGSYHMVVQQDVPVMDAQAVNIPVPATVGQSSRAFR